MDRQLSEWLFFADSDLKSAEILLSSKLEVYHISIYHSHQCVEKIMKSFLIHNKKEVPKVHSLSNLLLRAIDIDAALVELKEDLIELDSYYPKIRYPYGDKMSAKDARICYRIAKRISGLFESKIRKN